MGGTNLPVETVGWLSSLNGYGVELAPHDTDWCGPGALGTFLGRCNESPSFQNLGCFLSSLNRVTKELAALLASMVALFGGLKW